MIKSLNKSVHSHIKSLGLNEQGIPISKPNSIIGQEDAREAAGLIVEMVKAKKMAGRAILISGPTGCGKTALAVAINNELGINTPFTEISASEVYSNEIKKTEVLEEALRRSILVKIKEFKDIYEGEITELNVIEEENPLRAYSKTVKEIYITLKTAKGSKKLKLAPSFYDQIDNQKIVNGDIVYIESNSGVIKRLGRSESQMNDYDLEADIYVPLPKGEVLRKKIVEQSMTLHDLDVSNAKPTGQDTLSLISQMLNPKKSEITDKLRNNVNKIVNDYLEAGVADVIPGILFIDDVHMLDIECFTFLHKAIESPLSPIIIFASNKGLATVRGSQETGAFGMTKDLLDRILVIKVNENTAENKAEIIKMRLEEEKLEMSQEALREFIDMCSSKSLRYCLSLIPVLKTFNCTIETEHIKEVSFIFHDK